jgi:hypothetical protein
MNPLLDDEGHVLCHPSGGFTGQGDGECSPELLAALGSSRLVWPPQPTPLPTWLAHRIVGSGADPDAGDLPPIDVHTFVHDSKVYYWLAQPCCARPEPVFDAEGRLACRFPGKFPSQDGGLCSRALVAATASRQLVWSRESPRVRRGDPEDAVPVWLQAFVDHASANGSKPLHVTIVTQAEHRYYLFIEPSCVADCFADLFDAEGRHVCAPSGGLTGRGDGRCSPELTAAITNRQSSRTRVVSPAQDRAGKDDTARQAFGQ